MWWYLIFSACFLVHHVHSQTLGGNCRTPLNERAECISFYQCTILYQLLYSPTRTTKQTQFLHSSRCGSDSSGKPYVCCGTKIVEPRITTYTPNPLIPNPLIPTRRECGFQLFNKIFNGEATGFDEFPWMVVLQYLKPSPSRERVIACAGSLINSRYVLTAAHCVFEKDIKRIGKLINVRLGEYNTSSPGRDCATSSGIRYCNDQELNIAVAEAIPHPSYTSDISRLHDIALIRLATEVSYSDFIQPVCLPLPNETSAPGDLLIVAGWGKTEKGRNSDIKLKLQVPVTTEAQCANAFRRFNVDIGKTHICAGAQSGKDSCTGDSGGPLMRTLPNGDDRWMVEGIVSFGYNTCGVIGYPGVYTRVDNYVSWIHNTIRA